MRNSRFARWSKVATLAALSTAGGMLFDACGAAQIRQNFVAGTQAFVKGYTTDLWEAIFPAAEDLINFGEDNE